MTKITSSIELPFYVPVLEVRFQNSYVAIAQIRFQLICFRLLFLGVVVTFVDYGNTETVGKSQVWAINPDHCVIPKQAILCSLHNIASNDENGVWKSTSEYDNYFGKDSFKATLVENVEQDGLFTWSVNLIDPEGQDVADQLVANNLALRKVVLTSEFYILCKKFLSVRK